MESGRMSEAPLVGEPRVAATVGRQLELTTGSVDLSPRRHSMAGPGERQV